ncbi:hypothetical protein NQ314_007246 [Rhamnusium bicolor]|uniref:Hexosyltransferase n=1 Tax=Rhamnusium bicolor TaxID=1586634 RepID=A0AAV8YQ33_9CUCU|nr:hypothetical protein NQ314_007246 [Rhamnusium bicolor]
MFNVPIFESSLEERKRIRQNWAATRRQWAGQGNSFLLGDNMVLLRAVGAAEYANSQGKLDKFCSENGLRHKAVAEIRKLRVQLSNEIKNNIPEAEVVVDPKLKPPTDLQVCLNYCYWLGKLYTWDF